MLCKLPTSLFTSSPTFIPVKVMVPKSVNLKNYLQTFFKMTHNIPIGFFNSINKIITKKKNRAPKYSFNPKKKKIKHVKCYLITRLRTGISWKTGRIGTYKKKKTFTLGDRLQKESVVIRINKMETQSM